MDLNIKGRTAIVCGSSRGLGRACAEALAQEGVNVLITARSKETLEQVRAEILSRSKVEVLAVPADVTTPEGRDAIYAACPQPDILINNAGGPPPGNFRDWTQADWFSAINANMFSAIDMIRRCIDGMMDRRFGRIVNITSVAVKLPVPDLGLSNGARAGLTGFIAGIARDPARFNVTINNLLPGFVETDRLRSLIEGRAKVAGRDFQEYSTEFFDRVPAKRAGTPTEFAAFCAFLCSQQAGYFTAQNVLMDGGLYPGTL
jgi:3-oxoacyl-[acyl-carrier protein] reductase